MCMYWRVGDWVRFYYPDGPRENWPPQQVTIASSDEIVAGGSSVLPQDKPVITRSNYK